MYDDALSDWWSVDFQAMSRGGVRTETIWCNFEPGQTHYHTFAGKNFTDRQRIKRKAARWAKKFEALPIGERQALLLHCLKFYLIVNRPRMPVLPLYGLTINSILNALPHDLLYMV
mgnify:CR=1 FL=1